MTCLHSYADRLQRITRPDCSALPDAVKKQRGGGSRGKLQSRLLFVAKPSPAPQLAVKSEMQTKQVLLWRDGDVIAVTQKLLRSVGMCRVYPRAQLVLLNVTQVFWMRFWRSTVTTGSCVPCRMQARPQMSELQLVRSTWKGLCQLNSVLWRCGKRSQVDLTLLILL